MTTIEDNLRKVPPQNLEAESSILGGILLENEAINRVLEVITVDDFYRESHRKIFLALIELYNRREPVDLITLSDYLKTTGDLEAVGGSAYIACLANTIPTAVNIHHYARIVREKSQKRYLISVSTLAAHEGFEDSEDSLSIAARLSASLSRLQNGSPNGFVHAKEVVDKTLKHIEQAYERGDLIPGIPTGLHDVDTRTGGIQRGEEWVIAGRPGMGKTAIGGIIGTNAAKLGYGVAFVTAETPALNIIRRMLSRLTEIENRNLVRGKLADSDFGKLTEQGARISDLPFWLLDSDRSWDRIKAKLRVLKLREPKLALIIFDYVGLFDAQVKGERRLDRHLEIGRISGEAKGLAIELDVGVLLLSQLNRDVENRKNKHPQLSDLRESGALEQDADTIGLLYRDYYYNKKTKFPDLVELNVAKMRDGVTGIIKLYFKAETVSFSDWT